MERIEDQDRIRSKVELTDGHAPLNFPVDHSQLLVSNPRRACVWIQYRIVKHRKLPFFIEYYCFCYYMCAALRSIGCIQIKLSEKARPSLLTASAMSTTSELQILNFICIKPTVESPVPGFSVVNRVRTCCAPKDRWMTRSDVPGHDRHGSTKQAQQVDVPLQTPFNHANKSDIQNTSMHYHWRIFANNEEESRTLSPEQPLWSLNIENILHLHSEIFDVLESYVYLQISHLKVCITKQLRKKRSSL